MTRKPYSPPTVTDHGSAVRETLGIYGVVWEYFGTEPDVPPYPTEGKGGKTFTESQ
jgi:hypothetical protein